MTKQIYTTTGKTVGFSIRNNTEYYDKLLYYTPPSLREGGLVEYYLKHSVNYANPWHGGAA